MSVLELIITKGRICQWIVIIGAVTLCLIGGMEGWLKSSAIVEIMKYAFMVAGGVELIKFLRGSE